MLKGQLAQLEVWWHIVSGYFFVLSLGVHAVDIAQLQSKGVKFSISQKGGWGLTGRRITKLQIRFRLANNYWK